MENKFDHLKRMVDCLVDAEKRKVWANINVSLATDRMKTFKGEVFELARCMAVDEQEMATVLADEAYMNLIDEISRVLGK